MTKARPLLELTSAGIYCAAGDFHIDPSRAVRRAVITHGHSDHARTGSSEYYTASPGVPLVQKRLGHAIRIRGVPYGESFELGRARVSFHPAGHILGSAQVRVEVDGEVWVASGDYKRDPDPTCEPFEVVRCDTFITEATFGLPIYRWPPMSEVARDLLEWWDENRARGRASILYCYSLGKTQRVLAELAKITDRAVWLHHTAMAITDLYREQGVKMTPYRSLESADGHQDFRGELIITPPGGALPKRLPGMGDAQTAFASGWMRVRGGRGARYSRGFIVSDHSDWPSLVKTVRETGARRVLVTHSQDDVLVRYLRDELGIDCALLGRGGH